METLKVSSKSDPNRVAGALANTIRSNGEAELQGGGQGGHRPAEPGERGIRGDPHSHSRPAPV